MPTYQYRCTHCGHELEVVQKFTDPSLTVCPDCSGALRKVFNAVGVVFKGSGFYRTDSRADAKNGSSLPAAHAHESNGHESNGHESNGHESNGSAKGSDAGSKSSDAGSKGSKGSDGSSSGGSSSGGSDGKGSTKSKAPATASSGSGSAS